MFRRCIGTLATGTAYSSPNLVRWPPPSNITQLNLSWHKEMFSLFCLWVMDRSDLSQNDKRVNKAAKAAAREAVRGASPARPTTVRAHSQPRGPRLLRPAPDTAAREYPPGQQDKPQQRKKLQEKRNNVAAASLGVRSSALARTPPATPKPRPNKKKKNGKRQTPSARSQKSQASNQAKGGPRGSSDTHLLCPSPPAPAARAPPSWPWPWRRRAWR